MINYCQPQVPPAPLSFSSLHEKTRKGGRENCRLAERAMTGESFLPPCCDAVKWTFWRVAGLAGALPRRPWARPSMYVTMWQGGSSGRPPFLPPKNSHVSFTGEPSCSYQRHEGCRQPTLVRGAATGHQERALTTGNITRSPQLSLSYCPADLKPRGARPWEGKDSIMYSEQFMVFKKHSCFPVDPFKNHNLFIKYVRIFQ